MQSITLPNGTPGTWIWNQKVYPLSRVKTIWSYDTYNAELKQNPIIQLNELDTVGRCLIYCYHHYCMP